LFKSPMPDSLIKDRRTLLPGMALIGILLLCSLSEVAGQARPVPSTKDTMAPQAPPFASGIIEEIRRLEYEKINYREENPDYFEYIPGTVPILISAPHGAMHFRRRENRWKGEDEYTASLAIELGRLTGAHVIYVKNKTAEDPNNDLTSKYKEAIKEAVRKYHIKFILDVHGSDEDRPFKVDIGTLHNEPNLCSCPTVRQTIETCLSDFEMRPFNQKFTANGPWTITSFARKKLGIEAAQVEINARYRIVERKPDSYRAINGIAADYRADPKDVLDLVTRLERTINEIAKKICN
jgi:hypothetical protein